MYFKSFKNRLYSIKNQSAIPTTSIIERVVAENNSMEISIDNETLCLKNWKYAEVKSNYCIIFNVNVSSEPTVMRKGVSLDLLSMYHIYASLGTRCCICQLLSNGHLSPYAILNRNTYAKCSEKLYLMN